MCKNDVGDTTNPVITINANGQQYHPASAHASPKIIGNTNGAHNAGMPIRGTAIIDRCLSVFTYKGTVGKVSYETVYCTKLPQIEN